MKIPEVNYPLRSWLAENVRTYRTKMGISQEDLALKAGFHRSYVSQVERKVVNITIDNLAKIALALNVEPAKLLVAPEVPKSKNGID